MPIIHLNFFDVVSQRDFSMNVMVKDYIWSSYKTLKLRMGRLRREYTILYDGEVLNRHNKWMDYSISNNSTIILLEQSRQSRFTDSSLNFRSRASIAPLLTTFSADGLSGSRRLPAVPPPPVRHLPPPPPPRRYRMSYRHLRPTIPPGIIGQAVYRGQIPTSTNTLQDFSDIQSILRTVIQHEEDEANSDSAQTSDISVRGRQLSITSAVPFPALPNNDNVVESVEEIEDNINVFSALEQEDASEENLNNAMSRPTTSPQNPQEPGLAPLSDDSQEPSNDSQELSDDSHHPPNDSQDPPNDDSQDPPNDSQEPPNNSQEPVDDSPEPPLPSDAVMVIEFYRSVYSNQVDQLLSMGYTNETLILEALMLNQGDIMSAIDWMA